MLIKSCSFLLGLLMCCMTAKADDMTVFDIINNEDQTAFSDMVIIGYDINQRDKNGNTALMTASELGKLKFVRFLLLNDATINLRNNIGQIPLHAAAQNGHNEVISALVEHGAKLNMPDMDGNTPLMLAVIANKPETVELLHKLGASLNYHNAKGETALRIADRKYFREISNYLRKNQATY